VARLSQKVGPEVGKAGDLVYRAFSAQRDFIGNNNSFDMIFSFKTAGKDSFFFFFSALTDKCSTTGLVAESRKPVDAELQQLLGRFHNISSQYIIFFCCDVFFSEIFLKIVDYKKIEEAGKSSIFK
jgi:hypothetical protein